MKRVDDLLNAYVRRIEVGRGGTVKLWLEQRKENGYRPDCEWTPITVVIPKTPRPRRKK